MLPAAASRPETKPPNNPRGLSEPRHTCGEQAATIAEGTNAKVKSICTIHPESARLGPLANTPQIPQHVAAASV